MARVNSDIHALYSACSELISGKKIEQGIRKIDENGFNVSLKGPGIRVIYNFNGHR